MSLVKYLSIPLALLVLGVIYWFVSGYEWAGAVLLVIFAVAMAVMGFILVPTFDDVGPTAPVDPDWHERNR
jgi:hypothetical protein